MTSRTTAHLALFQQSQAAAVARIEEIVAQNGIDCNFRRLDCHGSHFAPEGIVLNGTATLTLQPVDVAKSK